jgi:STE24 endopeptidase
MTWFSFLTIGLIAAKGAAQLTLDRVNRRHVRANAASIPTPFRNLVDPATYSRSVEYTLAKSQLHRSEVIFDTLVLLAVLFSGILPHGYAWWLGHFGGAPWSQAAWLFGVGLALAALSLPLSWYGQFHLEERFGFNTTRPALWLLDHLKGLLLAIGLGYPLLILILKIVSWSGQWWWLWAWVTLMAFQLLMLVLAPVLIMPMFNKFTSLPEGTLHQRLIHLAERTGFRAQSIQVMDGSKRSRHSNAFFTGFGKFRKIVLFDTLIQQLTETELEAVLAHEIGHYKRKHIPQFLAISAVGSLAAFYVLFLLSRQSWFYTSFGFERTGIVPALLLFSLLSGTVSFWLTPLINLWSRRYEYEADAFAANAMNETQSLVGALRKLNEKNLSNMTPHPLYSGFYYSHPTLLEREASLTGNVRGNADTVSAYPSSTTQRSAPSAPTPRSQ